MVIDHFIFGHRVFQKRSSGFSFLVIDSFQKRSSGRFKFGHRNELYTRLNCIEA